MIKGRKKDLQKILESFGGIHLTAYLVNRGNLKDLELQIQQTLHESYEWLHEVFSPESRNEFLEPLFNLSKNLKLSFEQTGSIGIFRNQDVFEVVHLPFELERSCHVASSFHIKPLLRWLQDDPEFTLIFKSELGFEAYHGSLFSLEKISSFQYKKSDPTDLIQQISQYHNGHLYFSCKSKEDENLINFAKIVYADDLSQAVLVIREQLKSQSEKKVLDTLLEYQKLTELNLTNKNIFQIAKAAVQGRVKKLIVADDYNIFGKLDTQSGGLALHPMDLDYEDDDLLDDLAQKVLIHGGEVVIAKRHEIPENRPLLAILKKNDVSANKLTYFKNQMTLKKEP
ncbi:MAG: hypothetical protein ACK5V3_14740 [Bdellovibrionales bacterium]